MIFNTETIANYLLYSTEVDNLFISEYAKNAPGDYVKVFLIALMYARLGKVMENSQKTFGMREEDVEKAFAYWADLDLVSVKKDENGQEEIEFKNIREKLFGKPVKAKSVAASRITNKVDAKLFSNVENICGRLLEAKEAEAIIDWIKTYGASQELIECAYKYCTETRNSNRYRYVETILREWIDKGIKTKADVKVFLEENDKQHNFYKQVFNLLGFKRNPTKAEKEVMDSWINEYEFSLDDVAKACKKTSGISNPSINYVNKVLQSERNGETKEAEEKRQNGIKSIEDAYEKIRESNFKKAEEQRAKIYANCPDLGEVAASLREINSSISSALLSGNMHVEDLRAKQKELLSKKRELLISSGYKEDALDPIYNCKVCNDTGITEDGRQCSCYYEILKKVNENKRG